MNFRQFKYIVLGFLLIFISQTIFAQEVEIEALTDIIEQIAENSEEELDYTYLYETLMMYYDDPIDLNQASAEDLDKLMFLTFYQARSIIKYRDKLKGIRSIYELRFIDGIDEQTLKFLVNFVTVGEKFGDDRTDWKRVLTQGKHNVFLRTQFTVEQRAGYLPVPDSILEINPDKARYLGSPYKLYSRYRYNYKDKIYWGITAEKDAGEEFFKGSQPYGFDYYSAHLQVNDIGPVKKAILGDFHAEFGQGLTMWSGMTFGKGSSLNDVMKRGRGISRYGSANENQFLRGQAATFKFGNFILTEFFSYNTIDANLKNDTIFDDEEAYVSSILNTGFHRTPSELKTKNTIRQMIAGANLSYKGDWYHLGLTLAGMQLSDSLAGNPGMYNYHGLKGDKSLNAGLDYMIYRGIFTAFGETSMSHNFSLATLNGVSVNMIPEVSINVLHRHFEPGYTAVFSAPFSESGKSNNESGFYFGTTIYPIKRWRLDFYADMWKFPWLRHGVNAPSYGKEYLAQLSFHPTRYIDMSLRFKHQAKQRNNSDLPDNIRQLADYSKTRLRYHLALNPGHGFTLKTRLEFSRYQFAEKDPEKGFIFYQDINYKFTQIPLQLSSRFAVFNTDSYNMAIYAWEPDVLYAFSVPAYYDRGSRVVLVAKYTLLNNFDIWIRFAQTKYLHRTSIGSGLDEIDGNRKTDIHLQVRYKF